MQFEEIIKLHWREAADLLLKNGPKDCTCTTVSNYIENTYTQEQILAVNVFFWKILDGMDLESQEADEVRDECEYWWYAMENVEAFNLEIDKYKESKMS